MSAGTITVGRGIPYSWLTTITNADGSPFNLTGKTVWFSVKRTPDNDQTNANAVILKTITVHTTPASGITTIQLTNTDTMALAEGQYYWDLQVGTASSDRQWSGNGQFIVGLPVRL